VAVSCDTGDDVSVVTAVAEAENALGGSIDILVNCAATPATGAPFTDDDLDREVNVKVRGYLRCIRAVVPGMSEAGWGRIVNVSGQAARQTGSITGSIRNVAVAAMTKNLADELGTSGINITVVHPGMTVTERTPENFAAAAEQRGITPEEIEEGFASRVSSGRLITAAEVADVIAFLASPRSVAINGDAIMAGGGARGPIHY
jgi:NAD(P)-dependent dehydrogenase (short-subunit alcohol dehydrogenase family)